MMDLWFNHVKSYTQDILAENADNLKQFEIRPGVYSNVDPADLRDVKAADSTCSTRTDRQASIDKRRQKADHMLD